MANYKLQSAIEVRGKVLRAGTVITEDQFHEIPEASREMLLREEHVIEHDGPIVSPATTSPFPGKRKSEPKAVPAKATTDKPE